MPAPLILYFRRRCHLCEQMLAEIRALYGDALPVALTDVDSDPELQARYGLSVPVLMGRAGIISLGRLDRQALEAYLADNGGAPPV